MTSIKEKYKEKRKNVKPRSVTAQYVVLFSSLLLLTNIILGIVMYNQSRATVLELVRKNMLSISNTAAELMEGDIIGSFTAEDVGSPEWQEVIKSLSVFQKNNDIEYIYTVRPTGNGNFEFLVDPDPVNPGEIGEEVVVTDALLKAGSGTASVDREPAQDEWGNFYSSYSPVFDSEGNVAAIVGVDFDANWYEAQVREHMKPAIIIILFFVFLCSLIVFTFSRRMLLRVRLLNSQLSEMAVNVDELITQLSTEEHIMLDANPGMYAEINEYHSEFSGEGDEIEMLSSRLQDMQEEISLYKSFAHARACTDALTGVRNTTAYTEVKENINQEISAGKADFAIILFDINYLKKINDHYGHAAGDEVIRGAGHLIAEAFGHFATFRVGGDEFLVLEESISEDEIKSKLALLESGVSQFNSGSSFGTLSLSTGYAFFLPEQDSSVREVFIRADEAMYSNKEIMHRSLNLQQL